MSSFYPPIPQPGPDEGSLRPANAPNNGDMGGRPPTSGVVSASPFERLLSDIAPLPPGVNGSATAPPGGIWSDMVPPASPQPGAGTIPGTPGVININVGGAGVRPGGESTVPATTDAPVTGTVPPRLPPLPAPDAPPFPPPLPPGTDLPPPPVTRPPRVTLPRQPDKGDLARLPEGTEVITPYGTGVKRGGMVERYRLLPAGQEAHKRATLKARQRFGRTPFDTDPNWRPPIVIGAWNFNPYAADPWTKG